MKRINYPYSCIIGLQAITFSGVKRADNVERSPSASRPGNPKHGHRHGNPGNPYIPKDRHLGWYQFEV